jgi:hypothetical protein
LESLNPAVDKLKSCLQETRDDVQRCSRFSFPPKKSRLELGILDGIIRYLKQKHGGPDQEQRVVKITRNSGDPDSRGNTAELGPGIRWDFGCIRVIPTDYAMSAPRLSAWVVEVSRNGEDWWAIDRQSEHGEWSSWKPEVVRFGTSQSQSVSFGSLPRKGHTRIWTTSSSTGNCTSKSVFPTRVHSSAQFRLVIGHSMAPTYFGARRDTSSMDGIPDKRWLRNKFAHNVHFV